MHFTYKASKWPTSLLRVSVSSCLKHSDPVGGGGGHFLICKRLMGMCRWMGSHFHDWIDYNGVAFSIELLEWGRIFGIRKFYYVGSQNGLS